MAHYRKNVIFLLLASVIWGVAFVAQSAGGDAIGPFSFSCVRSLIAALVLLPVIFLSDRKNPDVNPKSKADRRRLWLGGILCGALLSVATNLQQMGLFLGSGAGKAGFLTAIYILFVPMLGLFFKRKCSPLVWLGVAIALVGMYLLCVKDGFSVQPSDLLLLACALAFAFQILAVDRFSPLVDCIRLSAIEHLTAGILSAIPMLFYDIPVLSGSLSAWLTSFSAPDAWIPLLYAGVLSSGVAYTLQIVGQKGVNPTIAALVMSLESVFSALAGWLFLQETLLPREIVGCVLVFAATILAQIPLPQKRK